MSKFHVNIKSSRYIKDKESFLKELKHFNESKNIPFKTPEVNGIEIDLYYFYTLVQQKGGLSKVNQNDHWDSLLRPLGLPHPCVNGSTLLRRFYGTYLEKFERAKGPPGRDDDNDMDDDPRRGRSSAIPRTSFASAGAYITASGEALPRSTAGRVASHTERLALSLLSPMPNEQDFAINVCTVLAADHSNRLPLSTTPHILDFLLAHAGVYNHSSLRDTIGRAYHEARGRYPDEFWEMRAGGGGAKELADETKFMNPGIEQPELMVQALAAHNTLTDCLLQDTSLEEVTEKVREEDVLEDWVTEPSEEDQLFAPALPGGASCVYTQRVLQIASIVRSLSFHEENVQYLSKNTTLIRFLLLCANCWVGSLRQCGLDTLGNISTELVIKDPATCLISRHVLSTIQSALVSPDRARVLAALELLNKLAQNEVNEDALLKALEAKVYSDVCALLTLRDIMVLVCTLECVYALTSLGDRASEAVARVPGLVHTLVSLVTVEAQSYGPRACILMRVVETVSGPAAMAAAAEQKEASEKQATQSTSQHVSSQQSKTPAVEPPATTAAASVPPAAIPTPPPVVAPVSNIQQSHMQQRTVQENEHFVQAWLRSTYEPLPSNDNSACDAAELYRQYLACCTKLGRKGVIAPAHFPRLVRTVFGGTVGPNTITISTGETQQVYIGIRAKNAQNRNNPPVGPSSPILKAQLTNKSAQPEVKSEPKSQAQHQQQQSSTSHPHLSQALESSPSNTTLIKHLLAHKVSPAQQQTQVAQRQQNQQRTPSTVLVQPNQPSGMEIDPEALIKCTTITQGGIASSTPGDKIIVTAPEDTIVPKEEPVQIQFDEQAQLTITAQNKMLADLLEKKSTPPVQVVQMTQQINAPTIQITETGQIVQVKPDSNPVIQINADGGLLSQPNQYFQIKNEQGQLIQIKNEQGQIIQLKTDQIQNPLMQFKNEPQSMMAGQIMQSVVQTHGHVLKSEKDQIIETVITDHSYTEPPSKKMKVDDRREQGESSPRESVSKTAANLYAALAASALEDEEDLLPPKQETMEVIQQPVIMAGGDGTSVIIQEPILQVQQPTLQVQQPTLQMQVQQPTLQVQQPMLQVQPMDVQNIIASQAGPIIIQEKPITSQTTQFVQQPMQIIAAPTSTQGGLNYLTGSNMMQKTIIIVQGPTGGSPLTLTVNNPTGLDDATLNSLIAQATEAITQQQIIQNPPQLTPSQQPIITTQPQPHKAQIVNTQQQIIVTPKHSPATSMISTTSSNQIISNQQILQGNQQILQGNPQLLHGNQQLMQGNQQIITVSNNQPIIMNTPKSNVHRVVQPSRSQMPASVNQSSAVTDNKTSVIQTSSKSQPMMRQVITRQPVMVGNTKIGDKELVVSQPIIEKPVAPKKTATPPPLQPTIQQQQQNPQDETPWICHWRGCGKTFENAGQVFSHAAHVHCPTAAAGEAPCLWAECDRVPRRTFALLNHIGDKHCTPQALKAIYNSRRQSAADSENKPVSLGYPPNAAIAALNKHAADMFNPRELMHRAEVGRTPEQADENEGPVTKSIRLTAALILRNIVIYSNTGRRQLRSYEAHLASIALSSVEASRTIAQVLYDMNNI